MRRHLTLSIVHQEDKVLLGMKKRGFGKGRWNGFGGKVEDGESIEKAAVREMEEEAHITPTGLTKLGILEFIFTTNPEEVLEVHVFKCTAFEGEVGESEEMAPEWFPVTKIPFESMWKDDIFWFDYFLGNKLFRGKFVFDASDTILESSLREVSELP